MIPRDIDLIAKFTYSGNLDNNNADSPLNGSSSSNVRNARKFSKTSNFWLP